MLILIHKGRIITTIIVIKENQMDTREGNGDVIIMVWED
jgi:hypothetical protein